MNDVGMNLAQRDQRPRSGLGCRANSEQHLFAISFHAGAKIVFGKAEIERPSAVAGGDAAGSRGESVDQPGNTSEVCRLKNSRLG